MAIRDIRLMGDPVLRTPASDVTTFDEELQELVRDLFETMYHAEGIGLAAPQVGVSQRVLVVDVRPREEHEGGRVALVNPRVVWESEKLDKLSEGCLSIPGLEEVVERPWAVKIEGVDPEGRTLALEADALFGRALQHEIDHLDGILFPDRVSPLKRKLLLSKWKKQQAEAKAPSGQGVGGRR